MVDIVIYENGTVVLNAQVENETIWLSQKQMAELFGVNVPAVSKHMRNIFKSKELIEKSVVSKMEITASDGKTYKTKHYDLDAIISIGYRVNSKRATQFRIWATEKTQRSLEGIVGNVFPSVFGEDAYPTVEEKAAHLLYFVVKNHPFNDGNKCCGSFSFIWLLKRAGFNVEKFINPNALTALTLLIAESNPNDKERMVGLVLLMLRDG